MLERGSIRFVTQFVVGRHSSAGYGRCYRRRHRHEANINEIPRSVTIHNDFTYTYGREMTVFLPSE